MAEAATGAGAGADQYFDFVVVGAGMIGSSAAKYLAEKSRERNTNSSRVAIIGVDSPGGRGREGVLCSL